MLAIANTNIMRYACGMIIKRKRDISQMAYLLKE